MKGLSRNNFALLACVLFVLGLDFFSKAYVHEFIPLMSWASPFYPYGGIAVFHNWCGIDFSINHAINKGAAWGIFASFQHYLLYFRIATICALAAYLLFFNKIAKRKIPLALIITGASGNVIDYFIYGHVIDMFQFKFGTYIYPVFNIADSAIFCGVVWLLFQKKQAPICHESKV